MRRAQIGSNGIVPLGSGGGGGGGLAPVVPFGGGWGGGGWVNWPWTPFTLHSGQFAFGTYPNANGRAGAQSAYNAGGYNGWSAGVPNCAWWLDAGCAPWDYWGICPNIFVGGACCSGCAEGKECDSKTQKIEVGARAVPFTDAVTLNNEAIKLSADVGQWATGKIGAFQPGESAADLAKKFPDPADGQFFLDFRQFKADWDQFYTWRKENPPPWYVPIPSDAMTEAYGDLQQFDSLRERYKAFLAKFIAMGGKTQAEVPPEGGLIDRAGQAAGGALGGAGKGVGEALAGIAKFATYTVVIGGSIFLLYTLGPLVYRAVRKK